MTKSFHLGEEGQSHLADLCSVIVVLVGHAGGDEVGIADGLHLPDVVGVDAVVKVRVQVVQQLHGLVINRSDN